MVMEKKLLILIVDDSRTNITLLANILRGEGYGISFAENGNQALQMMEKIVPDLVLLDIQMPGMDGFEVCTRIKHNPMLHHIPVIFITAVKTGSEDVVKGFDAGGADYVTKPFQSAVLLARVRTHLSLKKAHADLKSKILSLQKSEMRYRAVVEDQTELIWRYLADGTLTFVNRAFCRYMNMTEAELTGRAFSLPIHADDLEHIRKSLSSIRADAPVSISEHRMILPDGQICWIERTDRMLRDEISGNAEFQAVARDISDRKHLEQIKKAFREQEMDKLMRIGDRMSSLGRVSAGIAHEIRNPLSTINVYLKILKNILFRQEEQEGDSVSEIMGELEAASDRIGKIVRQVVDFASPGSPLFTYCDMNTCIREAIALSAGTLRKEKITLKESLIGNLPGCMLEPQSVSQVILNLISNAAEAMKNRAENKIIMISSSAEPGYIRVTVEDSGPGISLHDRDEIFRPFYTTKPGGLGIGLSIVRRIVRDHGGTLDIRESRWGGAAFDMRFPLSVSGDTEAEPRCAESDRTERITARN